MNERARLHALLGRVRRRWALCAGMRAGAAAAGAAAVPLALGAVAAWGTRSAAPLVALVAGAFLAACAAAAVTVRRTWRWPDDREVARHVEERASALGAPDAGDSVVAAVHVAASADATRGFGPLVIRRAVRLLEDLDPAQAVPPRAVRNSALQGAAGLLLLAASLAMFLPHAQRAATLAKLTWLPGALEIRVLPGHARVPAGTPLRIAADLHGPGADLLPAPPTLVLAAGDRQHTVEMQRAGSGFEYVIDAVDRHFEYRVVAGAAVSEEYAVTALFPPRVTRIDLRYTYPAFTGLPPREEEDGGDIHAPAGTRVRLLLHADKPLAAGDLTFADGRSVPIATEGASGAVDIVVAREEGYRVKVRDGDDLSSSGELEYFIRVVDDRPPTVRILRPAADLGITPLEEVVIEARADDDHGISRFELVYTVAGRQPMVVPLAPASGAAPERIGRHVLATEDLRVQPGDVISVYARARDVPRGRPSTETRSDMFFLEVRPFNEEFVAAESQGMGGGGGTPIDGLVAAQKEIISAAWNIERRSGTGRSAEDLRAIGRAQAELKARLEGMLGRRGTGPRGVLPPQQIRLPGQAPRRGGPDPAAAAIEAMGRAVEELERLKTADAIPHAMAALQGLLQAQAEIRRRQVLMQQAMSGGGGGTSRADRDLSALFDRELQREQRTTYESPPQGEADAQAARQEPDLMDRVRDLARRQGELAERQQELADAAVPAEERKRQLERLTREQQELRERLQRLEQDLARQASSGGSSGPGAQDPGAATASTAADAARTAAEAMARGNAAAAAASSARAAESLRKLEREIRGTGAEAQRRAAGDLQLEAQQIADSQRRIAAEADRLERQTPSRGPSSESARRLASRKDALAARVERLERRAAQLREDAPAGARARFDEAARQLREGRVAERMRDSARQLRSTADGEGAAPQGSREDSSTERSADVERQLARALDAVVDALAGADADSRRATDALDATREMRERLDRLERQVREAEARGGVERGGTAPDRPSGREAGSSRAQGSQGEPGRGSAGADVARAREEYVRELQQARRTLDRMQRAAREGPGGSTPEQHEFSRSAPGHEAFKQDFSEWESLRRELDIAFDRHDAAVAATLRGRDRRERLSGGGSQDVPDRYRAIVSRYFELLAGSGR